MQKLVAIVAVALLPWAYAEPVQGGEGSTQPMRSAVDLILIIDTSMSMVGAGGAPVIFPDVKTAAKEIIDWTEIGDNVVLLSYDEDVRVEPAIAIGGKREKTHLEDRIERLRATGKWTYTAAALRDAVAEAERLHQIQREALALPRAKLIVLMTDGIDDPPPHAGDEPVSLAEVAKRISDMPWFVWQIQLGDVKDEAVAEAFGDRHSYVEARGAKDLLVRVREEVFEQMQKVLQRSTVRFEPAVLDFGSIPQGGRESRQVRLLAGADDVSGRIRLRAETPAAGVSISVVPEEIEIRGGSGVARLTIELDADRPPGTATGLIVPEVAQGTFTFDAPAITWSFTGVARVRPLRLRPAPLEFGVLYPGRQQALEVELGAEPGAGGRIRLRAGAPRGDLGVSVEPGEIALGPDGKGRVQVTLAAGPGAQAGPNSGQVAVEVIEGAFDVDPARIDWSATVEPYTLRAEPATVEIGTVRSGRGISRRIELRSDPEGATGRIRLEAQGFPPNVQVAVAPIELQLAPGGSAGAEVAVDFGPELEPGNVTGRVVAHVIEGAIEPAAFAVEVTASVRAPVNPWRVLAWLAAGLVALAMAWLGVREIRRPKLHGELRYWQPGTGSMTTIDLERFGKRAIRMDADPASEVHLPEASTNGATVRPARREGIALGVVQPDPGSPLVFDGHETSELVLYDQDEFSFAGYTFEYRGAVPTRGREH